MKGYIFFSVHEELFWRLADQLSGHVDSWSGFVWGRQQARTVAGHVAAYDPLLVFTRDFLPQYMDGKPADLAWLEKREAELGISVQRMLAAERHQLAGKTHAQVMRMAEVALRETAAALDRIKPDFVLSEDISCFHSYVHFVLARERGIPFWSITTARVPGRIHVYSAGFQRSERVERLYPTLLTRGLDDAERAFAHDYVTKFRERPARPKGMEVRATPVGIDSGDRRRFAIAAKRYFGDPGDPTLRPPLAVIGQRLRRIARVGVASARGLFERPIDGEKYILYPIQYQPEASTLVQGPMYVDQVALVRDIAKSLPAGYRLYVKEHVSNRGRRELAFYEQLRAIPEVRLLGPDEDTYAMIRGAGAIATITSTVGWEGLMFDKPVITFGQVFYNIVPTVYRASELPKDQWYEMFKQATTSHRADPNAVLALVSALHQVSFPGRMANGLTFPEVLEPDNVKNLMRAVVSALGLASSPRRTDRPAL